MTRLPDDVPAETLRRGSDSILRRACDHVRDSTELIERLMRIALKHANARRVLLILPEDESFRIVAEARGGHGEPAAVKVALDAPPQTPDAAGLPESLLRHVMRTHEKFVLDDTSAPGPFPADPCLSGKPPGERPGSVLCIPLPRQAAVLGVLYLEGRPASRRRGAKQIATLELLAAQAAISLDNTRIGTELLRESRGRKRAEDALKASYARFAAILDSALEAIVATDNEQRIVFFNAAAERMFGWPAGEAIGESIDHLIPARFRVAHRAHMRNFAESGITQRAMGSPLELHGLRRTGEEFPVDAAISRVDCNGQQLLTVMLRDITERRRAEEELRLYREHLEELVAQRTAQLAQAKRKAEEADRLKSVFLTTMSHELRTPLNAILGYAQILARNPALDERQTEGLNIIRQSGEHLLTLINDILDLSKIEAGRFELNPEPVNLPRFLETVSEIVAFKAEQKGLVFTSEIASELPGAAVFDEKRLRQVLLNLLGNAVKFTERGRVTLRVRCQAGEDARLKLRFEIQDTGIGIGADQLEMIFQPFEQVGAARQRSSGTGLGLAISRQLMRLMGSDIHAESQPGQGSLFWFELAVPRADTALVAEPPAEGTVTGYLGKRRTLLIVDDVTANRAMLVSLLAPLGFTIHEAKDGQEAVAQAQATHPDLILMDVKLPLMDGPEATRRIRELPGFDGLPVLAVSASTANEEKARSLAAGASAFLGKPIDLRLLLKAIGDRLDLAWIETPPQPAADSGPLLAPPRHEVEILRQLALAGNMRHIKQRADHLKTLDPRYGPFADRLRDLARRYQTQALLALVNQYLKEADT